MKSMRKVLLVAVIALITIVCASSVVSAGWFGFLGGSDTSLDGKEVNLTAAASLKNVYYILFYFSDENYNYIRKFII